MRVVYLKRKIKAVYDDICPGIWDLFYEENSLIGTLRADEEIPAKDLQETANLLLTYQEKRGMFPPTNRVDKN